ncbi:calcineurin B-like protein 7 isoform X2 [Benincasa hispida]|uniref:calcineurin B-like protein 7 isoform X2 n=1 Tax=Benincasa hispida TaxID=102211 RepID=UPI001902415C|nr:calcineurin B-like protein 7 isoform X2 [Benincasa hispida]
MGCKSSKPAPLEEPTPSNSLHDTSAFASDTPFSESDIESLHKLFQKLSDSVIKDGQIHKEELRLAIFKNVNERNLFLDRIFYLFDANKNGRIGFGEFVRTLSVFHPNTPKAVKIAHAFKLYDLRHTGFIEREELREMVLALLSESDLVLPDDVVEMIVDKVKMSLPTVLLLLVPKTLVCFNLLLCLQTFTEADAKGDGKIDEDEWKAYVAQNPSLLKHMTLPYLIDMTLAFPSFVDSGVNSSNLKA